MSRSKKSLLASAALVLALTSTTATAAPGLGYDTFFDRVMTKLASMVEWALDPAKSDDDARANPTGDG